MELLSALESEHIGRLLEIDKRLRAERILIEGYKCDPIMKYVAVKIDVMRTLRSQDELLKYGDHGASLYLERLFSGIPGYVVVTDAQMHVSDFDGGNNLTIQTTTTFEHTFVLYDGKYVCEWADPKNPLCHPEPVQQPLKTSREIVTEDGIPRIRYNVH